MIVEKLEKIEKSLKKLEHIRKKLEKVMKLEEIHSNSGLETS